VPLPTPDGIKNTPTKEPRTIDEPVAPDPEPTVTVTVTAETTSTSASSDTLVTGLLPWAMVVVLLAAVTALAAMVFGKRNRAPLPPPPAPAPDPASSPVVPELITLADLITTPAAQTQVVRALRTVGVEPIDAAVGAVFDPDVHEAVATRPAQDPAHAGTIAVVHRAGWYCASGVVRPAGVEVWMADAGEGV